MVQAISYMAPLSRALSAVKQMLFRPWKALKWLGLGFCAWLAALGLLPIASSIFGHFWHKDDIFQALRAAGSCPLAPLPSGGLLIIGACILLMALLIAWISSRGKFMLLGNLIVNQAEVVAPWKRYRAQANSYFLFVICLRLLALLLLGGIVLSGLLLTLSDIARPACDVHWFSASIPLLLLLMVGGVIWAGVLLFLEDFVIPLMLLRAVRTLTAWGLFFELFQARPGTFILYALFKTLLSSAALALSLLLCCCFCWIIWVPYIGTLLLLPIIVCLRCYSLYFLEQFGPAYRLFQWDESSLALLQEKSF